MKFIIATLIIALLGTVPALAQTASGTVLDDDGTPLEGATIVNLRSGTHAHTNEVGHFTISNTTRGDSVRVSHIGFKSRVLVYTADTEINEIRLHGSSLQLSEVVVSSGARTSNIIADIDLRTNPVNSSQELLRKVPGLFIGQHAGGGKAEQIFLRGFDIDHGTDINITVDGMPVNMVSHAHGQGYADLHFLVPETVEKIDFDKGPYDANKGNLATAGYVAFKTKERLDHNSVTLEAGKFNTFRTLGLFNVTNTEKQSAYVAAEYLMTDGPFVSPQHFNRVNLMGKYTAYTASKDKFSLSLSHFTSKWDASGQVPQRAVDAGLITRFGAIDDTEGGNTSRTNVNLQFDKYIDENTFVKNTAYYSKYDFELYSNFTFFLNDPVNGDQIKQKEERSIIGLSSEYNKLLYAGNAGVHIKAGTGFRYDDVQDIELSHTLNRKTVLQNIMVGDIDETNLYGYAEAAVHKGNWKITPGVRVDYFKFDYVDKLAATYKTQSQNKAIVSPKLNFVYTPGRNIQYFLKLGKGFHSNDTRVVVAQNGKEILPAAYGADLGVSWKPLPRLIVNSALWYLYLQQEFVYVGDEGVVEPSGKTQRKGIDLGLRYQFAKYFYLHGDFTYTHARSMEAAKGEDYIPLAPRYTAAGGVSIKHPSGLSGSIRTRWLGHRPANEDNSIVAKGYCVTDMNMNFQWKHLSIGIITENIFNTQWNETQFATTSRLQNEAQPVTEIHFTPGTPLNIRGFLKYSF